MLSRGRQLLSDCIPPIAGELFKHLIKRSGYFGNYSGWEQACQDSTGYDSNVILERVRDALVKVKKGEAVYERDSVLFDEIQYSWPLLAGLLWIASCNGNCLNLLDFGGSLGSSYFQNRKLLGHLSEFSWSVVEQEKFVLCGREVFEDDILKFYFTIDECLEARHPDALLLCSVIPYLEKPYELLQKVIDKKFTYVVFDRTPFLSEGDDRLTVQKVSPEIYVASYPAWFLNKGKFLRFMESEYELVVEFDALAGEIRLDGTAAIEKGFVFRKKGFSLNDNREYIQKL